MTLTKTFLHAFGGGEMSPDMTGRVDDTRRQQGAARIRNAIVTPQGPVQRRRGSKFVTQIPDADETRLVTFRFSADQSFAVQIGPGYFRFIEDQQLLLLDAVPATYIPSLNVSAFNAGTDELTFGSAHGRTTGDIITFTTDATLPPEINQLQNYAVIVVSPTVIKVALTVALALAGTAVNFTLAGGETARMHFVYNRRDLVRFGSHNFYCAIGNSLDTTPGGGSTAAVTFTTGGGNFFVQHTSHGFVAGTAVVFAGANLPPEIVAGRPYFVSSLALGTNAYKLSETYEKATVETIEFSDGSGTDQRAPHWYQLPDDNSVVVNGSIYEVPNNYVEADLPFLTWDSSFDVLSLANKNRAASELRRFGTTSWEFVEVDFAPLVEPLLDSQLSTTVEPGATIVVSATDTALVGGFIVFQTSADHLLADGDVLHWSGGGVVEDGGFGGSGTTFNGNGEFFRVIRTADAKKFLLRTIDNTTPVTLGTVTGTVQKSGTINLRVTSLFAEQQHTYQVTVVDGDGRESEPATTSAATNNLNVEGASITVSWPARAGANRYRVYRKLNGLFGFVGEVQDDGSATFEFKDENVAPDLARTPPVFDTTLDAGNYPTCVAHFEQRRLFGGLQSFPQRVMATRTGTESDMTFHIPIQDDDRIVFDIASREAEVVRHIVPLAQLLLLTSATEYRVTPVNSDAITPTSIAVRPQTFIGASPTQPVIVNNTVVFAADRGGHLRELGFDSQQASFITGDLSLRTRYLFDGFEIRDLRLAVSPIPIVWAVSTSGKMIGLTYAPEEQIGSFHVHETDGEFESCTVVPEGPYDNLYVVVKRTIDGNEVRYIECIEGDPQGAFVDSYYVDCGTTYSGAATTTITGLDHLEGETVVALADGVVRRGLVVSSGQVTLPVAAAKAHVGLPVTALIETLPLLTQLPGFGQGVTKNIDAVSVRVLDSAQFRIGPAATPDRSVPVTGLSTTSQDTKQVPVTLLPKWDQDAALLMVQDDPLPFSVVCLTINATSGGT